MERRVSLARRPRPIWPGDEGKGAWRTGETVETKVKVGRRTRRPSWLMTWNKRCLQEKYSKLSIMNKFDKSNNDVKSVVYPWGREMGC